MEQSDCTAAGFKELEIGDKPELAPFFGAPDIRSSELTFSNLFMWRRHYRPLWRRWEGGLLLILRPAEGEPFGLQPLGFADPEPALEFLCRALDQAGARPRLARLDGEFIGRLASPERYKIEPDRDQSDYVYLTQELIKLPGRRFHRKKNLFNRFVKKRRYQYLPLDHACVEQVLEMQQAWCTLRDCDSDPGLRNEDAAIFEALSHYDQLDYTGGAIVMDGRVEAFTLGELLNPETAVIHIEKANPEIPGLYAAINQMFCAEAWSEVAYVNREQDLGLEGLRAAKKSYNPCRMVDKYTLSPTYL